jgi:hypothetical protein
MGGAPGILPDQIPEAAKMIANPAASASVAGEKEAESVHVSRKFKVKNDLQNGKGFPILLGGCLTHFPKGKIVDESAYDVDGLRRQGLELEELT